MFGILFTFNFYGVYHQNHRAHAYRDQVANLIENFDGDLVQVDLALKKNSLCSNCTYTAISKDLFVEIEVAYELSLKVLNIKHPVSIKGITYLPPKSS